jgi:hypothetical protein
MRVVSNLQWPDRPFARDDRLFGKQRRCLVGFDVEWTKNYQIRNGSRPFCYSIAIVATPTTKVPLSDVAQFFGYKSVYVDHADEEQQLIDAADADLAAAIKTRQMLVGHQVTSDIGVLKSASVAATPGIDDALDLWHHRRTHTTPGFFDTRYDIDHLLSQPSRRLVDVCAELRLDVLQPEISGSMTKVHRSFLERSDETLREKLMVLNLRHSLSSCLVALLALDLADPGHVDVNDLLIEELWDQLDYVRSGTLQSLLDATRATLTSA